MTLTELLGRGTMMSRQHATLAPGTPMSREALRNAIGAVLDLIDEDAFDDDFAPEQPSRRPNNARLQ